MDYEEVLQYLYSKTPAFHQIGAEAYKPGLERTTALDNKLGNPHQNYRIIHVAGTNGKGSVAHLLAAILRESKYKVGLYTSPHLVDFCERIRVNGKKISQQYVVDFIERNKELIEEISPSFFEITSTLAFDYFRHKKVDFAIIETGLGGRLDSTNIITPVMSIITNISMDHMQYLGNTPAAIAKEKAGIIKEYKPTVIGNASDPDVRQVFLDKGKAMKSPIYFAEEEHTLRSAEMMADGKWQFQSTGFGDFTGELGGYVQKENAQTVLAALQLLVKNKLKLHPTAVQRGFEHVVETTGLMGRWQTIQTNPSVICDTGHNVGAWGYLGKQLAEAAKRFVHIHMIAGMVNDKDINGVLSLMPQNAIYYFTQASIKRACPVKDFATMAQSHGLQGKSYPTVKEAVSAAMQKAETNDLIFIGGSTFIVAEALPLFPNVNK